MITVGIDSAETTGIGILDRGRLVKATTVKIAGWREVERVADAVATFFPDLVAIEDCYIRPNDRTGIVLAKLIGRWEQAFQRRGIPTVMVLASTWQPAVLPITHRAKRAERKAAAVTWARETLGASLSEDEADAAAIAWWAAKQSPGTRRPSTPKTPGSVQMAKPPAAENGTSGDFR